MENNMPEAKNVLKIDVVGQTCPVPLVEARKAIRKAKPGDIIEITGTHPSSKKEIPMAVESMGLELVSVMEKDGKWTIQIKIPGESNG